MVAAIISGYYGLGDIPASINPDKNATWFPLHAHWTSEKLASKVDSGKILTLSPIFAVELDRDIYPEFVTGPFAWRTAHFVPENQRSILGVVAPEDLEAFLSKQPPSGILVGNEPGLEAPFLEYAEQYGYSPEKISSKQDIWLP